MKAKSFSVKKICSLLFILLFLAGCGEESLYQDLAEQDANEILVVLYQNGIHATKVRFEKAQEVSYSVMVSKNQLPQARRVLVDNNLPRRKELGFSGICKEKGLIPTPEEEKCRKLLALKGEIINSLQRIPGVIEADVVINIPEISEFSTETQASKRPTASTVLRVKQGGHAYELTEAKIQRFISNAIENLDPRDVSVVISYVQPPSEVLKQGAKPTGKLVMVAGLALKSESAGRFKIYAILVLALLLGVSAALILNVIKLTKMRQELRMAKGGANIIEARATPALPEGGAKATKPELPEKR
jgi:type III secretion protein J